MGETFDTDIVIIGAGVIGLAVAARLSGKYDVVLLESHEKFGQETSSRNSEVIHSGIYYPKNSQKTSLCLRGRDLLYAYCEDRGVPYRQLGKILVATEPTENGYLDKLSAHCEELGVPRERWSGQKARKEEPLVEAAEALFFPQSGIVDSHSLLAALERQAQAQGAQLAYRHQVLGVAREKEGWAVEYRSPEREGLLKADLVVNASGLSAARLSNSTLTTTRYEHRWCRGRYFSLRGNYRNRFRHLIYPVPEKHGLGVHVTLDLSGQARLGPDTEWCDSLEGIYECDWESIRENFLSAVNRYCSSVKPGDLLPSLIGVRPKLFLHGEPHPDFLIENHHGYIHCLGIESPGLTASLAIAERIEAMI